MKNKILRITKNNIPYAKELRSLTKSIASAILMQQLDFWFFTHPDKFYKFMTKPDAPTHDYKDGDSWEEEIGINVDEFRSAFDNIGIRYKTKTEYLAAKDKFDGRYYCSYFDRTSRKTWYFRNHDLLDAALDNLMPTKANKEASQANTISRNGQKQSGEIEKVNLGKLKNPSGEIENTISGKLKNPSGEMEKSIWGN